MNIKVALFGLVGWSSLLSGALANVVIDPDDLSTTNGTVINTSFTGVTLSAGGGDVLVGTAVGSSNQVFAYHDGMFQDENWTRATSPNLRADFMSFTATSVSIEVDTTPMTRDHDGSIRFVEQ